MENRPIIKKVSSFPNFILQSISLYSAMIDKIKNIITRKQVHDEEQDPTPSLNQEFLRQHCQTLSPRDFIRRNFTCTKCKSLYRFAYTLVHCGHTFCRECIFKEFKQRNQFRCEENKCGIKILSAQHFEGMAIKDIFKQNIVDKLVKGRRQRDQRVFNALSKALKVEVKNLLPEYNNPLSTKQQTCDEQSLENTCDTLQKHYIDEIKEISQQHYNISSLVQVHPSTEKDYSLVRFKGRVKYRQKFLKYLRLQLQKYLVETGLQIGELPDRLEYKIALLYNNQELNDGDDIAKVVANLSKSITIYYQIRLKA